MRYHFRILIFSLLYTETIVRLLEFTHPCIPCINGDLTRGIDKGGLEPHPLGIMHFVFCVKIANRYRISRQICYSRPKQHFQASSSRM
ncbi:hypothetical protein ECG_01091 [Echinococcus granulosus]|uniref:Secreted protein n=1 Tax=Echinococcus granulosus TaxID=6210 RepID=A0A068WC50_ECHGR|nr:hypothetical protein ECG_01091 [Echinococcus granulosus]CDS16014.1 hypothetical protein EgrG_000842800 [Echinococcus granulosus]